MDRIGSLDPRRQTLPRTLPRRRAGP
jgi:hypothetical protein